MTVVPRITSRKTLPGAWRPRPELEWTGHATLDRNSVRAAGRLLEQVGPFRLSAEAATNSDAAAIEFRLAAEATDSPHSVENESAWGPHGDWGPEGYALEIQPNGATITAAGKSGWFYGLQTLVQLLPTASGAVPCQRIRDLPRYRWRGMHLDVGRHFFDVPYVKRYLDLLAMHKCNVFHWHLTEDQGWRLEIPAYPRLTEISAWRQHAGETHGGWYTHDDVREVVAYAADRCIRVVPEIELPGHCLAVLAAYPEFSCAGGPFQVTSEWGIIDDVFCAGQESVFRFLEEVFGECAATLSQSVHPRGGRRVPQDKVARLPPMPAADARPRPGQRRRAAELVRQPLRQVFGGTWPTAGRLG